MASPRRHRRPIPRHLITTTPKVGRCAKCHQKVLQCMVYGTPSSLEPVHLSLVGEARALIMGIWTYNVTIFGEGHPLPRSVYHIRSGLPEHSYIVPAHRCGVNWSGPIDLDDREIKRWRGEGAHGDDSDEPPF